MGYSMYSTKGQVLNLLVNNLGHSAQNLECCTALGSMTSNLGLIVRLVTATIIMCKVRWCALSFIVVWALRPPQDVYDTSDQACKSGPLPSGPSTHLRARGARRGYGDHSPYKFLKIAPLPPSRYVQ